MISPLHMLALDSDMCPTSVPSPVAPFNTYPFPNFRMPKLRVPGRNAHQVKVIGGRRDATASLSGRALSSRRARKASRAPRRTACEDFAQGNDVLRVVQGAVGNQPSDANEHCTLGSALQWVADLWRVVRQVQCAASVGHVLVHRGPRADAVLR